MKEVKNLLGMKVGNLVLKGYFDYDHQNPPEGYITEHTAYAGLLTGIEEEHEVVKMHNIQETICRMTVKGKFGDIKYSYHGHTTPKSYLSSGFTARSNSSSQTENASSLDL